jgi:hypothetical protein
VCILWMQRLGRCFHFEKKNPSHEALLMDVSPVPALPSCQKRAPLGARWRPRTGGRPRRHNMPCSALTVSPPSALPSWSSPSPSIPSSPTEVSREQHVLERDAVPPSLSGTLLLDLGSWNGVCPVARHRRRPQGRSRVEGISECHPTPSSVRRKESLREGVRGLLGCHPTPRSARRK